MMNEARSCQSCGGTGSIRMPPSATGTGGSIACGCRGNSPRSSPAYDREPIDTSKLGPIKYDPNSGRAVAWDISTSRDKSALSITDGRLGYPDAIMLNGRIYQVVRSNFTIDTGAAARKLKADLMGGVWQGEPFGFASVDAESIVALAVRRLVKGELT